MAKEKLFTPEDFDKPNNKPWYKKPLTWCIAVAIAAVGVGGTIYYRGLPHKESPLPVDTTTFIDIDSACITTDTLDAENPDRNALGTTTKTPESYEKKPNIEWSHQDNGQKETIDSNSSTPKYNRGETLEIDAKMAIRGDFGNGLARKKKLGSDYQQVQTIVNQLIREGKTDW